MFASPHQLTELKLGKDLKFQKELAKENQDFIITPSGSAHLCCLAPGQHSSEAASQRQRVVGDVVSDFGFEPQTFRTDSNVITLSLPVGETINLMFTVCLIARSFVTARVAQWVKHCYRRGRSGVWFPGGCIGHRAANGSSLKQRFFGAVLPRG